MVAVSHRFIRHGKKKREIKKTNEKQQTICLVTSYVNEREKSDFPIAHSTRTVLLNGKRMEEIGVNKLCELDKKKERHFGKTNPFRCSHGLMVAHFFLILFIFNISPWCWWKPIHSMHTWKRFFSGVQTNNCAKSVQKDKTIAALGWYDNREW